MEQLTSLGRKPGWLSDYLQAQNCQHRALEVLSRTWCLSWSNNAVKLASQPEEREPRKAKGT